MERAEMLSQQANISIASHHVMLRLDAAAGPDRNCSKQPATHLTMLVLS